MAFRASSVEESSRFRIGEEGFDFRCDVCSGERLCIRSKLADHPVEENGKIFLRDRRLAVLVFALDQLLPSRAIQRVERVIVDAMASGAVFPNDLPDRTLRELHARPRGPALRKRRRYEYSTDDQP